MTIDVYEFLGRAVAIRSDSPAVLAHLRSVYDRFRSKCAAPTEAAAADHVIEVRDTIARDGGLALRSVFGSVMLYCLDLREFDHDRYPGVAEGDPLSVVQWLVLRDLGLLARDYLLLHAGAVARDGSALIFPAHSGGGKTTLTVKLVMEGYGFLSDEVACLHLDRGVVEPFPRRINLADSARRRLGLPRPAEPPAGARDRQEPEWSLDVGTIARDALAPPARLGLVIFPSGFDGKTRLDPLPAAEAALEMLRLSHAPIARPAGALFRLAGALRDARCYRMVLGDPDEAATAIGDLVERGAAG